MRVSRVAALLLALLPAGALAPPKADAGEPGGPVPKANTAYVKSQAAWLRRAVDGAEASVEGGDWNGAVRRLQEIVDTLRDDEHEGAVASDVLPVCGSVVYEGAWIVAHHRILAGGAPALEAYARAYGGEARALLDRALARRDRDALAEVVDRFLPLAAGRRAALVLADLALEEGDRDGAVGWLERLEDVEEVTREEESALAPWRAARIRRAAAAFGRVDRLDAVRAHLERIAGRRAAPADRYAPVPPALRPPPPVPPPGLGTAYRLDWQRGFERDLWEEEGFEATPGGPRPSPPLLPRAVVDWPLAFVNDGSRVYVWDMATGRIAAEDAFELTPFYWRSSDPDEAQKALGLIEGFSLTLGPRGEGGRFLYVASPDVAEGEDSWDYGAHRNDALLALWWDGRRLEERWRLGGVGGERCYGAPLLYRDRLWIAALRPATEVDAEAWLYGLDPKTGAVETRTYLGTGSPPRVRRPDEAIPSSPSGAAGRVVVITNLGLVAAVDARTGRPAWIYRNDREVRSAGRPPDRLGTEPDRSARESGFANQPPLLALERVYVAPTDGQELLSLHDRPRGPERLLVSFRRHRLREFGNFAPEQIAGLHPGGGGARPMLVLVGQGGGGLGGPPPPIALGLDPLDLTPTGWEAHPTTGHGPVPFGVALVTSDEVLIPTRHGIGIHDARDGRDVATLDISSVSPDLRPLLPEEIPLFGNLVPVPGRGILVVNEAGGVFWRVRKGR